MSPNPRMPIVVRAISTKLPSYLRGIHRCARWSSRISHNPMGQTDHHAQRRGPPWDRRAAPCSSSAPRRSRRARAGRAASRPQSRGAESNAGAWRPRTPRSKEEAHSTRPRRGCALASPLASPQTRTPLLGNSALSASINVSPPVPTITFMSTSSLQPAPVYHLTSELALWSAMTAHSRHGLEWLRPAKYSQCRIGRLSR